MLPVVLCPDPIREERVWWCSASLTITFRESFPSTNHITENTICSAAPEILGYFSTMTQHFLACKLIISSQLSYEFSMKPKESAECHQTFTSRVGSRHETLLPCKSVIASTCTWKIQCHFWQCHRMKPPGWTWELGFVTCCNVKREYTSLYTDWTSYNTNISELQLSESSLIRTPKIMAFIDILLCTKWKVA